MSSVNKVILIGRLGRDPEVKYMQSGDAVCNTSIATSEQWKDKSGEKQERTDWHNLVLYGRTAEVMGEYVSKGHIVYVEGRLRTRKYTDKNGVEKYVTEVNVDRLQLLPQGNGKKGDDGEFERNDAPASNGGSAKQSSKGADDFDDDIPF